MWAHPDILSSRRLWGKLRLGRRQLRHIPSLALWLARRRAALCSVRIEAASRRTGLGLQLAALLRSLGCGGRLSCLALHRGRGFGEHAAAALQPLAHLGASLRCLDISGCRLSSLPPSLSGLSSLTKLSLDRNPLGGSPDEGAFEALAALAGLKRLRMKHCGLAALPGELAELSAVEGLKVCKNSGLGQALQGLDGEAAWEALEGLRALRTLRASGCGLPRLPRALSACPLRKLDLSSNPLGEGGSPEGACQPLEHLSGSLTKLVLESCSLRTLPHQVSATGWVAPPWGHARS